MIGAATRRVMTRQDPRHEAKSRIEINKWNKSGVILSISLNYDTKLSRRCSIFLTTLRLTDSLTILNVVFFSQNFAYHIHHIIFQF